MARIMQQSYTVTAGTLTIDVDVDDERRPILTIRQHEDIIVLWPDDTQAIKALRRGMTDIIDIYKKQLLTKSTTTTEEK